MNELGRITVLQVANLGVIKYANIRIDNNKIHKIVGPNASGKSTLINAIRFALEGKDAIPPDIIRHGEFMDGNKIGKEIDRANIRLETSNGYVIERIIRKNSKNEQVADLKISKDNKAIDGGPQAFLKTVLSSFRDPQKIANMSSKELFDLLLSNVDLSGLESQLNEVKLNQQYVRKSIKNLGVVEKPTSEFINVDYNLEELLNKKTALVSREATLNAALKSNNDAAIDCERRIKDLDEERKTLVEKLEICRAAAQKDSQELSRVSPEIEEFGKVIAEAKEAEASVKEWDRYNSFIKQKEEFDKEMESLKTKEENLITTIRKAVTEAKLPMDVRCTEDRKVFVGDILWENVETSRRLTEGIKYCVSMIPENGLKLLTIERGESIGTKLLQDIEASLEEHDAELIMEVFSESEDAEGSILLEDGNIRNLGKEYVLPPFESEVPEGLPDFTSPGDPELPESKSLEADLF